jgi:hypothetical protein
LVIPTPMTNTLLLPLISFMGRTLSNKSFD